MSEPVDTDALRAMAAEMDNDDWTDWSSTEAHVNGEKVDAAADEVDRLRAVIENAPHSYDCERVDRDGYQEPSDDPFVTCTCWKANAP